MVDTGSQSTLEGAADSGAALIGELGLVMYIGAAVIFLAVCSLAVYAVAGRARPVNERYWVVGAGLVFPTVVLSALLVYSLAVGNALAAIGSSRGLQLFLDCFGLGDSQPPTVPGQMLRIRVIGKQWWWEVRYERADGTADIVLANEIHIPAGEPIELVLTTTDVIHSLWIPSLAGKVDMIPGRTTTLRLQTSEEGRFSGVCAEYCGGQHAMMKFSVVSVPRAQFEQWLGKQSQPAELPTDAFLRKGHDAFFKGNCHSCHAIRGTTAAGVLGPDLTHVGGRQTLAAGVLDNHIGTMAGWIAGAQEIKPGNAMPSLPIYTGEELRALSAWLGSLK